MGKISTFIKCSFVLFSVIFISAAPKVKQVIKKEVIKSQNKADRSQIIGYMGHNGKAHLTFEEGCAKKVLQNYIQETHKGNFEIVNINVSGKEQVYLEIYTHPEEGEDFLLAFELNKAGRLLLFQNADIDLLQCK